jgi:hypothetical protein
MRLFRFAGEGDEVEDAKRISPEISSKMALTILHRRWFPVEPSEVSDSVAVTMQCRDLYRTRWGCLKIWRSWIGVLLVVHSHGELIDLLHGRDKVLHMFRYMHHNG